MFSKFFGSFRSFEFFSKKRSRRDDSFGANIIEIGAILAIFRLFEFFFRKTFSLPWAANHMNKNMKQLNPWLNFLDYKIFCSLHISLQHILFVTFLVTKYFVRYSFRYSLFRCCCLGVRSSDSPSYLPLLTPNKNRSIEQSIDQVIDRSTSQ